MKLIKKHFLFTLLIILAISIRGYRIDTLPSLNPDEAALGYNAYSLLQTGKDEHGISWPLHFKSFGDYKPGGYVYLAMPFIKYFGLNPLAVRLPNLFLSVLTIFVLYRLTLLLTSNFVLSNIVAFVLTISPWHIHFSRGAWESSAALFFILLGIYWFYSYLQYHKYTYLFLFPVPLAISLYFYHSARIIAPVLILILIVANLKILSKHLKPLILSIFIGIILSTPVTISFFSSGGTARLSGVGLSADYGPIARAEELLNQHANTNLINRIIHNRRILYALSWSQKYTSHFDLNFLFIDGDNVPRSKSPDMGQLYLIELPLLILGIVYLLKFYNFSPLTILIFSWLFISPLASSLTFQAPSALRSLPLIIPLSILIGMGIYYFFLLTAKYFPHNLFFISIIYIYSLFYFFDAYFIHAPKRYPFAWNTGFEKVIPFLETNKNKLKNIYFTDKYDQPYILYLFYTKYPPQNLQPQIKLTPPDQFGFSTVKQIDNIHFGKIIWDEIPNNSLIFAADEVTSLIPITTYYFPNQQPGFKIYIK